MGYIYMGPWWDTFIWGWGDTFIWGPDGIHLYGAGGIHLYGALMGYIYMGLRGYIYMGPWWDTFIWGVRGYIYMTSGPLNGVAILPWLISPAEILPDNVHGCLSTVSGRSSMPAHDQPLTRSLHLSQTRCPEISPPPTKHHSECFSLISNSYFSSCLVGQLVVL